MVTHKGIPIRSSVDFLAETLEARRKVDVLKILKEKLSTENTLSSKVVIRIWRRRKGFPRHTKAEVILQQWTCLLEVLKGTLLPEKKKKAKVHKTLSKVINSIRKLPLCIRITFKIFYYSIKVKGGKAVKNNHFNLLNSKHKEG